MRLTDSWALVIISAKPAFAAKSFLGTRESTVDVKVNLDADGGVTVTSTNALIVAAVEHSGNGFQVA